MAKGYYLKKMELLETVFGRMVKEFNGYNEDFFIGIL
tara:strand:+ start:407 stop:517 length:111 start_codon:yes stop_codon:yes gene_type:complete